METVDNSFFRAEGILDLTKKCQDSSLKPRRLWLRRLAFLENLNNYYRFAVSSVILFQDQNWKAEESSSDNHKDAEVFYDKSHASALSFYGHARVCLESSRALSEETVFISSDESGAESLQKHRDSYTSWAQDLIEKRNGIVAHPLNARKMIVGTPNVWGSHGRLTFFTVDLEHIARGNKEYELNPVEDLKILKKYIEEMVVHLGSIWFEHKI